MNTSMLCRQLDQQLACKIIYQRVASKLSCFESQAGTRTLASFSSSRVPGRVHFHFLSTSIHNFFNVYCVHNGSTGIMELIALASGIRSISQYTTTVSKKVMLFIISIEIPLNFLCFHDYCMLDGKLIMVILIAFSLHSTCTTHTHMHTN